MGNVDVVLDRSPIEGKYRVTAGHKLKAKHMDLDRAKALASQLAGDGVYIDETGEGKTRKTAKTTKTAKTRKTAKTTKKE